MRVLNRRRTLQELKWCAATYRDRKSVKKDAHYIYRIGVMPKRVRF